MLSTGKAKIFLNEDKKLYTVIILSKMPRSLFRPGRTLSSLATTLVAAFAFSRRKPAITEALVVNPAAVRHLVRPELDEGCHSLLDANRNGIAIRATKSKGLGAFLGGGHNGIKKGEWVGEYTGEILSRDDVEARYWDKRKCKPADRRWKKSRKRRTQGTSGDYLFDMGDDLFLDGEDTGVSSWCRFMNHAPEKVLGGNGSRDGDDEDDGGDSNNNNSRCNVETKCSRLSLIRDGSSSGGNEETTVMPRLWFVARRDIAVGEELLYDYGDSYW